MFSQCCGRKTVWAVSVHTEDQLGGHFLCSYLFLFVCAFWWLIIQAPAGNSTFKQDHVGVRYRKEVEVGYRETTGGQCSSLRTRNSSHHYCTWRMGAGERRANWNLETEAFQWGPQQVWAILEGGGPWNTHPNLTLLLHSIPCWYFSLTESRHNPHGKGAYWCGLDRSSCWGIEQSRIEGRRTGWEGKMENMSPRW